MHQALADTVLLLHLVVVVFVVGGLAAVIVGNFVAWHWVNKLWFRVLHLGAVARQLSCLVQRQLSCLVDAEIFTTVFA